jgi:hypothetical protein
MPGKEESIVILEGSMVSGERVYQKRTEACCFTTTVYKHQA